MNFSTKTENDFVMTAVANPNPVVEPPGDLLKETSIVVCTVDRMRDLEDCLKSLLPFSAAGAEIMVVNNGPHQTETSAIAARHDAHVITESKRGVSRARNAGIRTARGSIVAFLDDDSFAAPNWLPLLVGPFLDPEVVAVVGSIAAQTLADPVSQAFDSLHRAQFPASAKTLDGNTAQESFPMRSALVGNANMAIRREAFDRFGFFDTRFGRGTRIGSGEEPDMLLRILLGGARIAVQPAAQIFHRHSTEWRSVRTWAFTSGCAHTAMLAKYFLGRRSLRGPIITYATSRLRREQTSTGPAPVKSAVPRLPFLLGSLYGPLAYLISGKD